MSEENSDLKKNISKIVTALIYYPLAALIVWWMWNLNVVGWVNLPAIGYWQTMGIIWMIKEIITPLSTYNKE